MAFKRPDSTLVSIALATQYYGSTIARKQLSHSPAGRRYSGIATLYRKIDLALQVFRVTSIMKKQSTDWSVWCTCYHGALRPSRQSD